MEAFILANISDVLSIIFGLNLGWVEINPVINCLIEATSVPEAVLVKLAAAASVGLLVNRWNPRLLTLPTLAFSVIAISNSLLGLRYL